MRTLSLSMQSLLRKLRSDRLLQGGAIVFVGSFGLNILSYLFNIIAGRILGPEGFGVFTSLFSVFSILIVFSGALNLICVKFSSILFAKQDFTHLGSFTIKMIRYVMIFSLVLTVLFWSITPWLYRFLHLDSFLPLHIVTVTVLVSIVSVLGLSILQGMQRFIPYSLVSLSGGMIKVSLALVLSIVIIPSHPLIGIMLAIPISNILVFVSSLWCIRDILPRTMRTLPKIPHFHRTDVLKYTIPSTIMILGITILNSVDIILAKHYLVDENAGYYAGLATLGKIIFFATSSIPLAMFPIVSARHALDQAHHRILYSSVSIVTILSTGAWVVYEFFGQYLVTLFLGQAFLPIVPYLGDIALIMGMYSVVYVIVNYYLSIHKYFPSVLPIIASITLVGLLYWQHDSLEQVVTMILYNMIGLFVLTMGYTIIEELKN